MTPNNGLAPKHILLALFTVLVWGTNFIAIHVGLQVLPPFLLCTLRFGLGALPWIFFLPRPQAPVAHIVGYGVFSFALQFGALFYAISLGLSAGLASLVVQMQIFFSMGLAAVFFHDKPGTWKIIGSLISFTGIGFVAAHVGGSTPLPGLLLALVAALSWAIGNMFTKRVDAASPLALVVWGNLVALPCMLLTSIALEGPELIVSALQHIKPETIGALLYTVYMSTHIGYGAWGFLLKHYPTASVVPFTLLIPVVGFVSSTLLLGEEMNNWKLWASAFVMTGLIFNMLENRIKQRFVKTKT